jgi:SagB-type dehydrogenase family enzyme
LEAALNRRESVREYTGAAVSNGDLSQLLWAAQGVRYSGASRTAPSAGALYPLELYVLAGDVTGLESGLYRYRVAQHDLIQLSREDLRRPLADVALDQPQVKEAAAVIVLTAVVQRTAAKYGERALRYVHMEVGCAGQNIHLQAAALGLGTVFIGAFRDARLCRLLNLADGETPQAIFPVGRRR